MTEASDYYYGEIDRRGGAPKELGSEFDRTGGNPAVRPQPTPDDMFREAKRSVEHIPRNG